jgi:ribosomal 50S subunit-recycling heat shock protein
MAGEACQRGKILIDGAPAKASREVRPGMRVVIDLGRGLMELEILAAPAGNIQRTKVLEYYQVIRDGRPTFEER